MEEKVKLLKEQIYANLKGEPLKVHHVASGRCSGRTYALICAMEECICELYDINQALLSNQKSIIETNEILLGRLLKLSGAGDVDGKDNN